MLPVFTVASDLDGKLTGVEFEENIFVMAACSFRFCAPEIFCCSYRDSLCEVTRKEIFAVSEDLGAQMWEDMVHSKKYLRKKASLGVLTLYRIFCCFIDSLSQLSKLLHLTILK